MCTCPQANTANILQKSTAAPPQPCIAEPYALNPKLKSTAGAELNLPRHPHGKPSPAGRPSSERSYRTKWPWVLLQGNTQKLRVSTRSGRLPQEQWADVGACELEAQAPNLALTSRKQASDAASRMSLDLLVAFADLHEALGSRIFFGLLLAAQVAELACNRTMTSRGGTEKALPAK